MRLMDLQQLVDGLEGMVALISVEKREDGYGKIRIVTGNREYIDSVENPALGTELLTLEFVPNQEYTRYLTRDLNFEESCYQAAVLKKHLHAYAHPDRIPVWFNMTFLPVAYETDELAYCLYIMEIDMKPDAKRMSNVSGELAADVLSTSLKLRFTPDFKEAMGEVIKDIREMCSSEYCCILLVDEEERECSVLCEDIADGSDLLPMEKYLTDDFYELAESWQGTIAGSNCIIAKNDRDMEVVKERNPRWYKSLTEANAKSIVLFPLKSRGGLLGYIWAINFDAENAGDIKEILEVTTFILASEIANYMLLERLKTLSSQDMLTGVLNRNEMNNVVAALGEKTEHHPIQIGIVYADVNGLKTVNDKGGHDAGDELLKDAAAALLDVFEQHQIFRAGGDEFVVMLEGASEAEVETKIEKLMGAAEAHGVSFAVGSHFEKACSDIYEALRDADKKMYEDKARYYEEHPDKRHERDLSRI